MVAEPTLVEIAENVMVHLDGLNRVMRGRSFVVFVLQIDTPRPKYSMSALRFRCSCCHRCIKHPEVLSGSQCRPVPRSHWMWRSPCEMCTMNLDEMAAEACHRAGGTQQGE